MWADKLSIRRICWRTGRVGAFAGLRVFLNVPLPKLGARRIRSTKHWRRHAAAAARALGLRRPPAPMSANARVFSSPNTCGWCGLDQLSPTLADHCADGVFILSSVPFRERAGGCCVLERCVANGALRSYARYRDARHNVPCYVQSAHGSALAVHTASYPVDTLRSLMLHGLLHLPRRH